MAEIQGELIYYAQTLDPSFKELLLAPTSDIHYGNPLFSEHHLKAHITFLKDTPNAFTILNGDLIEAVTKVSKGDVYKQKVSPQDQRDYIINLFGPIKDKVLGMTTGNHENRIYNETGIDVSKDIAERLGCPYRAEGLLLKIAFGDLNKSTEGKPFVYYVYCTHGYGGARTKAAKAVKVERVATWIDADVYILSHDHVVNVAPDVYLVPDNRTRTDEASGFTIGKITAHRKMLIKSGAFIKWGGYSEMLGFPPVDLNVPIIKFSGENKPHVSVEI